MDIRLAARRLVMLACSLAPDAFAASVEFGDGDFAAGPSVCVPGSAAGSGSELAGYELVKDVRGGPDGFTCFTRQATGGNPDAWARATIEPEGGQITACMFKDDAIYDPSVLGALAYVDFTEDGFCLGGGPQCMSSGLCVRQGGNLWIASTGFVPEPDWTAKAVYGVAPGDFVWLSGPAGSVQPDFSASAPALQFGFARAKSGGPGEVTGVDNWRAVIHGPCMGDPDCDDANACTTETCAGGVCERSPLNCSDGDDCTQDVCTAGTCSNPPRDCDDGSNCTADGCVLGECQSIPTADLGTVSDEIDALLAILEGPACGEELLKRTFLKKFAKKLKKARGKIDRADGLENVLKIPGLIDKAGVLLEKARGFLQAQATKGTISPACADGLTGFVSHIEGCLAFVPTF